MERNVLPSIRVPTLVLHRRGDLAVPVEHGRYLAEHIPGARFVGYPDGGHLLVGRQQELMAEITGFLRAAG